MHALYLQRHTETYRFRFVWCQYNMPAVHGLATTLNTDRKSISIWISCRDWIYSTQSISIIYLSIRISSSLRFVGNMWIHSTKFNWIDVFRRFIYRALDTWQSENMDWWNCTASDLIETISKLIFPKRDVKIFGKPEHKKSELELAIESISMETIQRVCSA